MLFCAIFVASVYLKRKFHFNISSLIFNFKEFYHFISSKNYWRFSQFQLHSSIPLIQNLMNSFFFLEVQLIQLNHSTLHPS